MNDDIQALLDHISAGSYTESDLATLHRALIVNGQGNLVQVGKYSVHIGEGQNVRIGDTIYQGPDAKAIREALQQVLSPMQVQQERIAEGLKAVRAEMATLGRARAATGRTRVTGQRPREVSDYFKDRIDEVNRVRMMLTSPMTRLVSILGRGGMGKTALACKVLGDFERRTWPDEQAINRIVYLSTRTTGISLERIFLACAKSLDPEAETKMVSAWTNPQLTTTERTAELLEALAEGTTVVLLDNLEDLLDSKGQLLDHELQVFIEQTIRSSAAIRFVVTSRQPLALGHQILRFDQQVKLVDGLPVEEGVAMLRDMDPDAEYGLRDADDDCLVAAVKQVHSVPRALEVLAGILANDPLATLDDVLKGFYGHDDVVKGLIIENYRRLSPEARHVMEALAVLRRPVPVVAVDYLLAPFVAGLDVPAVLRQLARTGIASIDRSARTVTLHPIDQDYAYSQLPDETSGASGYTRQALERRAAEYYRELRTPEDTWKTIDDLVPQLAEFEHLMCAGEYDDACRLMNALDRRYLGLWGHYSRVLQMRMRLQGRLRDKSQQMINYASIGRVYRDLGQADRAVEFYEQACLLAEQVGDHHQQVISLKGLGSTLSDLGRWDEAVGLYERALVIISEHSLRQEESGALVRLANIHFALGGIDRALDLYQKALASTEAIQYEEGKGVCLERIGRCYRALGKSDLAINYGLRGLEIARKIGYRKRETIGLAQLGLAYRSIQELDRSTGCFQEGREIAHDIGSGQEESQHLLCLVENSLLEDDVSAAVGYYSTARALESHHWRHRATLLGGVLALQQRASGHHLFFSEAIRHCESMLGTTQRAYELHYTLAAAIVGTAIQEMERGTLRIDAAPLSRAISEYQQALAICSAPGVVQEAILDLELIEATGVEGLEPVFELLAGHEAST